MKWILDKTNLLLFIISFLFLWFGRPTTVGLEDSGGFFISACNFGISHPPGYPLYNLLGSIIHVLTKPFFKCIDSILFLNIILASSTILLLNKSILVFSNITNGFEKSISFTTSLFLLTSRSFSFLARSSEVYILHLFFVVLIIYLILKIRLEKKENLGKALFFVLGLSISNHWPLIILLFPFFIFFLSYLNSKKIFHSKIKTSFLYFILGLIPYLFYFINPYISDYHFYKPVENFSDAIHLFLRRDQMVNDTLPSWEIKDSLYLSFNFIERCLKEFGFLGATFGLFGILFYYPFIILSFSIPIILPFLWRTEINQFTLEMFQYWELSSYLGICLGIFIILRKIYLYMKQTGYENYFFILLAIFFLNILSSGYNQIKLKNDNLADEYSKIVLQSLPENSILFVHKDTEAGILGFKSYVEKFRTDVQVISQVSALLPIRVFSRKINPSKDSQRIPILNFISKEMNKGKRIFTTRKFEQFDDKIKFPLEYTNYGIFFEISETKKEFKISYEIQRRILEILRNESKRIEESKSINFLLAEFNLPWKRYREFLTRDLCHTLLISNESIESFENLNECNFLNAQWIHVNQKNFDLADEYFRKSLPHLDYLYKSEKVERYKDFFLNRISYINSLKETRETKIALIENLIKETKPIAIDYKKCDNRLAILILNISTEIELNDKEITQWKNACKKDDSQFLKK